MPPSSPAKYPKNGGTNGPNVGRVRMGVFCGAHAGDSPVYMEMAHNLGVALADKNIELVYGGGTVGLMGEVARTVCSISGESAVHGVIPESLIGMERSGDIDSSKHGYGHITVVKDRHTRKMLMSDLVLAGAPGSGFLGLPGGYGTVEELFEVVTWNQLNIHSLGICLINVDGFWDGILQWVKDASQHGFIKPTNAQIIVTAFSAEEAVERVLSYSVSKDTYKLKWT